MAEEPFNATKYTLDALIAQGTPEAFAQASKLARQTQGAAPAAPAGPTAGPHATLAAIIADPDSTLDHAALKSLSQKQMGELMDRPGGMDLINRSMVALDRKSLV
jgi:hypothetical protein